jgi:hypothetical protein
MLCLTIVALFPGDSGLTPSAAPPEPDREPLTALGLTRLRGHAGAGSIPPRPPRALRLSTSLWAWVLANPYMEAVCISLVLKKAQ